MHKNRAALIGCVAVVLFVVGMPSVSHATVVTYGFDPNDWVTNYSPNNASFSEIRVDQDNPRIYIDGVQQSTDAPGSPGVHTTYAGASYSSTGIAGYQAQVGNVEIHKFNMWLADGINAPSWGEVLTQVEGGALPSGTATNGWAAEHFDNPWPQGGYGDQLVRWYDVGYYDDDPNTAANPLTFGSGGIDFGGFSLTVDLNDTDIYGNPVDFAAPQRIWLGCMLPLEWTADPDDLVYADNHRFEGTMTMNPIPEPSSLLLIGGGLVGLVGVGIRRKKA